MSNESTNPKKRRSPLGVIFLTLFLDLVGFSIIFPLFPAMLNFYLEQEHGYALLSGLLDVLHSISGTQPDGSTPNPQVIALFGGVLGGLYSLLQFVCAPFWGSLSDRVGRRRVLLVTVAGIALSYALWFVSGSFTLLVVARILGGIMSGNIAAATAAVADVTTGENRAKGMGMVGAAFGLGFILGPAIGGGLSLFDLSEHFPSLTSIGANPFSTAAGGAMLLSLLNLLWIYRRFDETLSVEDRSKAQSERRSINPIRLLRGVDLPGVDRGNLTNFLFIFSFSGMEFSLMFLAAERFGFGPGGNALLLSFAGVTMALVQGGLIRRLAPRYGEVRLATAGLAIIIPGLLLTGFARSVGMLYFGVFVMAIGAATVIPSLRALVSRYAPTERQGEVLGVFASLGSLARAAGPLVAGALYWRFSSEVAYCAGAAIIILPLLLTFGLPRPATKEPQAS